MCADTVSQKLKNNNIFTVAKRNVDGQDMLYQSMKLINGIWVLAELKIKPGNTSFTVSFPRCLPYVCSSDWIQSVELHGICVAHLHIEL